MISRLHFILISMKGGKLQLEIEYRHHYKLVNLMADVFSDEIGFSLESYRKNQFNEFGLPENFVQDEHSGSVKCVLVKVIRQSLIEKKIIKKRKISLS